MNHSVRFNCVLDTNVIYPIEIRDLLFWFAYYDLYTPKWSKHIFDEWIEVMNRKGVSSDAIDKRTANANMAFPDAIPFGIWVSTTKNSNKHPYATYTQP